MDDFKIYIKNERESEILEGTIKIPSLDTEMDYGIKKCEMLVTWNNQTRNYQKSKHEIELDVSINT